MPLVCWRGRDGLVCVCVILPAGREQSQRAGTDRAGVCLGDLLTRSGAGIRRTCLLAF